MNIESNTGTIGLIKLILLIISSVCTTIAAISYTRISYRSKALDFYKSEITALREESDLHKLQIQEMAAHLESEKLKAEAMQDEVTMLRRRTDYTLVEDNVLQLTNAVNANISALTQAVNEITRAVTAMQVQCAKVHEMETPK
jgi:hypothetical protein